MSKFWLHVLIKFYSFYFQDTANYSTAQFQLDYYTRVTNAQLYTFFRLLNACMRVHL